MRKPYDTKSNLNGFAENAQIKAPEQLEHLSVPIESVEIHGQHKDDGREVHVDTKMPSPHKMGSFGNSKKG